MFCPSCGNEIPKDSVFCEFCGARRVSDPLPPSAGATPVTAVSAPPQLDREQLGGLLLKSMTLGDKFVALGSVAGILGFFLPWGTMPNLDIGSILQRGFPPSISTFPTTTTNRIYGFDIARMWGGFYFVLLGAVAAAILFFASGKASLSRKLTINAFQVLIGSLAGPQMLFAILLLPMAQEAAGFGWWMTCLGYCAIATGGIINIAHLGKQII